MKTNVINILTSLTHYIQPLNFTWEISETSLAFSLVRHQCFYQRQCPINYCSLQTTDSHSYLLSIYLVKNSSPCLQCLRSRRVCSDNSDFTNTSDEMYTFFQRLRLFRLRCRNRTSGSPTRNPSKNSSADVPEILGRKNSIHTDQPPTKQSCKNNILTNSNYFKKQKQNFSQACTTCLLQTRQKSWNVFS